MTRNHLLHLLVLLHIPHVQPAFQHPPALFHRRGEPFNAHDYVNHPLYTNGCYTLNADNKLFSKKWCFEKKRPDTKGHKKSLFDFLTSRQLIEDRVRKTYDVAHHLFTTQGVNLTYSFIDIEGTLKHFGSVDDPLSRGSSHLQTSNGLLHGAEQIEYLIEKQILPKEFHTIAQSYRATIAEHDPNGSGTLVESALHFRGTTFFVAPLEHLAAQYFTFNTLLYYPLPSLPPPGSNQHAINRRIDWKDVERRFLNGEIVVVDDVLEPWALDAAYNFCLEATIYYEQKIGYVGAYDVDGLNSGPFPSITEDFRTMMPSIVGASRLAKFWSYKYVGTSDGSNRQKEQEQHGTNKHTDQARVNLNVWITPDDANLDPSSGGMDVWDYRVDNEEMFNSFQLDKDGVELTNVLKQTGSTVTRIPYKRNRMVIFDSNLVHETSQMNFKQGHKNRRINLTWLFGNPSWKEEREVDVV
jgi:hypothetical protein